MNCKAVKQITSFPLIIFVRQLRGLGKKKDQYPRLLKGKVVTLDNNIADKFGPVEDFEEMNRTLRKMFVDPQEIQSEEEVNFEEDDYSNIHENPCRAFALQEMNDKELRRFKKRKIIKKKYFPEPKENNLLTCAAKNQIRYLHQLNPLEWTPERLSQSFPISVDGAKKLLRNNFKLDSEEQVKMHDAEVLKRWKILKSNKDLSAISPETVKLWKEGKLLQDFYSGNTNFPQPPQQIIEETKMEKVGEHLSIIKKYLDIKKQRTEQKKLTESTSVDPKTQPLSVTFNQELKTDTNQIRQSIMPKFQPKYLTRSEMEDEESASYLATEKNVDLSFDPEVTSEQYEDNLIDEFANKEDKTEIDEAYLEWLNKRKLPDESLVRSNRSHVYDSTDSIMEIKKSKNETIELMTEIKGENSVPYLYDSKLGYQYPMGKNIEPDYIKIPPHLYKKGAVYQVEQCFYDDTGEFLYKLPFTINKKI